MLAGNVGLGQAYSKQAMDASFRNDRLPHARVPGAGPAPVSQFLYVTPGIALKWSLQLQVSISQGPERKYLLTFIHSLSRTTLPSPSWVSHLLASCGRDGDLGPHGRQLVTRKKASGGEAARPVPGRIRATGGGHVTAGHLGEKGLP